MVDVNIHHHAASKLCDNTDPFLLFEQQRGCSLVPALLQSRQSMLQHAAGML
jgi:hypothetical protein